MSNTVLCIEGKRAGSPTFVSGLEKKGFDVIATTTGKAAMASLRKKKPRVVIVNAASLRSTGSRICQSLRSFSVSLPIILIIDDYYPEKENTHANIILQLPFTIRKLVNRIMPFIPGDGSDVVKVGKIKLDLERLKVKCEDREQKLTPRLVKLLKMLMDHPGEVIERNTLFSKVWSTDYTEDTRTLDVHISWLRQAIEEDPKKPKFLITIRGVGYRLDA